MENIRLLLVDDETDFRAPLKKRLARRGFVVLEAGDGDECQAVMNNASVDVVVLDVKMPGMNGIEVLEWIKENYKKTEVIMLTGHASAVDGVEGIKKGAFDYLTKPLEFPHLVQKIEQAVEKKRRDAEKQQESEFKTRMEQQMISTERLASLGTLSTGIAHEIDNPLAIIKESAEYMRLLLSKADHADMPRKSDFENAVGKIETAIERAKRITHQLLGFVRKPETFFAETDLKVLVAETVEFAAKGAEIKGIQIVQDMEGENGTIWSDPYEIRQVLFNLLTNAIHAVESDGTITVSLKGTDSRVMLIVEDTGKGIPKENLEKIFEPFFTTKPPGKGTGLGLYVTCGIVERLGGVIDITSRVGKGSRFQVALPRSRKACGDMGDNKELCVDILNKIKGDPAK